MLTKRGLWAVLLLALIGAFEFSPLDLWLQDQFFDFATSRWAVDAREPIARLLFYTGPKAAIIGVGVVLVGVLAGPRRWRAYLVAHGYEARRRKLLFTLVAAGAVPAVVGALKNVSGVYCPSELVRYGGSAPYLRPFVADFCGIPGGHCWPAGHASGGFALVALTLLVRNESRRVVIATVGCGVGWTMGLYQMFKGAHFMSHTLVTMFLALSITRVAELFGRPKDDATLTGALRL